MSVLRIVIGVIVGGVTFAAMIFAAPYFGIHLAAAAIGWCVLVGLIFDLYIARKSRLALGAYWKRNCTGVLWKRRFPTSSKASIRQFLDHFVSGFAFPGRQLSFAPDDCILDIYRALYPDRSAPDDLELETFAQLLKDNYGIDLVAIWHDEITLGELYARTSP